MRRIFIIGCLTALAAIGASQTEEFNQVETGFVFSYPQDWKFKKSKKGQVTLTMPLPESSSVATLDVFDMVYSSDIPTWQAIQADAAKNMKREVVRQWQEEILTVPMLMCRTQWEEKGIPMMADNAIIYANTDRKLVFRLAAPSADFSKADSLFRNLLQTLRRADNRLPKVHDPSTQGSEKLNDSGGKPVVIFEPRNKPTKVKPVRGDQSIAHTVGGVGYIVTFSGGWTAKEAESTLSFTHPDVDPAVRVGTYSALESDPAGKALIKASSASLGGFKSVALREEKGPLFNKAGATYAVISRGGTSEKGALFAIDAVVSGGDYYALITWQGTDAKSYERAKKAIGTLIDTMNVELKPAGGS